MATESWSGYPPEVNSGRWEAGTGPETWMAASAIWTDFAGIVLTATTSLMTEIAMMTGVTLTGMASVSMLASSVPFIAWLAQMEALALVNAAACATVAEAWATATAGIIPLPVVNQNRITEATLQATNFFGINNPAIAELNREYAQFWSQDGTSMMTYDEAVITATMPKPAPPPPPLSSVAQAAAQLPAQAAQTAANAAQNASQMSDVGSSMQELAGSSTQGGDMSSMMGAAQGLMGPMQSVMGAANPSQLGQGLQSLMGPAQQMLGQFMSGPQMGGGLNGQFSSGGSFASTGGVPLSSAGASMGAGGGGGGMGLSGAGGGPMGALNSSTQQVKPISNLSGVPGPTLGSGNQATNSRAMGGGVGPMGGARGGGQESTRKSETIMAANINDFYNQDVDSRKESALFR